MELYRGTSKTFISSMIAWISVDFQRSLFGGLREAAKQTAENERHVPEKMLFTDLFAFW